MRTFYTVWTGQLVSLVGTSLTGFGLAIFVFLETGSATQLSLILLAGQLPQILVTPFAGAIVDRWDRRWAMLLADSGAGVGTMLIAFLVIADRLEIWHLVVILSFSGVFQAFQWPAYSAATTLLVPKERYASAAGLVQLAEGLAQVAAPAIAGVLLAVGGLAAIIVIDVATFLFAIATLLVVRFPAPKVSAAGAEGKGSLWTETKFGFRYLRQRSGLMALLAYFAVLNLIFGFLGVVVFPLILGFASEQAMGTIFSIAAVGMVAGSLVMSAWGGPKRLILGVIGGDLLLSVGLIGAGLRPNVVLVTIAAFFGFFAIPIANSSSQAIWQRKVDPDVQGRVFAVRRMLAQITGPLALIAAGPLLDRVFEPMLVEGGTLAGSVGSIIGTGPGRGTAFFFIL
ncbi:MAG: MFS transporter, partial [Acidimicrobiia bacterium]